MELLNNYISKHKNQKGYGMKLKVLYMHHAPYSYIIIDDLLIIFVIMILGS